MGVDANVGIEAGGFKSSFGKEQALTTEIRSQSGSSEAKVESFDEEKTNFEISLDRLGSMKFASVIKKNRESKKAVQIAISGEVSASTKLNADNFETLFGAELIIDIANGIRGFIASHKSGTDDGLSSLSNALNVSGVDNVIEYGLWDNYLGTNSNLLGKEIGLKLTAALAWTPKTGNEFSIAVYTTKKISLSDGMDNLSKAAGINIDLESGEKVLHWKNSG